MESNADKNLRNKLKGAELPFDPQAWDKMEAMLDKRKRRPVIFWWLFSGAALLLLGGGLLWMAHSENNKAGKGHNAEVMATELGPKPADKLEVSGQHTRAITDGNEVQAPDKVEERNQKVQEVANAAHRTQPGGNAQRISGSGHKGVTAEVEVQNNRMKESGHYKSDGTHKTGGNKLAQSSTGRNNKQQTSNPKLVTGNLQAASKSSGKHQTRNTNPAGANEQPVKASDNQRAEVEELLAMQIMPAQMLTTKPTEDILCLDKMEEGAALISQAKRKTFIYSIGAEVNVTGSSIGKQSGYSFFYNKPSYMVGLTHEFLFIERIAITNALLFSQTGFKVYNPAAPSFANPPADYTSSINEFDIAVGLKGYIISKSNFRFYAHTGVINHIKLKETFAYKQPEVPASSSAVTDNSYPVQTNFANTGTVVYDPAYTATSTPAISGRAIPGTADFSIHQAKRYYLSYYAALGVEGIIKNQLVLFAEPGFYMGLNKIGVQEKYKYNIGGTLGFRYQFTKR